MGVIARRWLCRVEEVHQTLLLSFGRFREGRKEVVVFIVSEVDCVRVFDAAASALDLRLGIRETPRKVLGSIGICRLYNVGSRQETCPRIRGLL